MFLMHTYERSGFFDFFSIQLTFYTAPLINWSDK